MTPRPELNFRSEALAGPESRHKTAQPTQTPHHSLCTSDNAKPLVRKDRKEFELIEGRTRSVYGGCWGILIEKQLMDQQLSQAYRLLYITEARVQAPFELEPPHSRPPRTAIKSPRTDTAVAGPQGKVNAMTITDRATRLRHLNTDVRSALET